MKLQAELDAHREESSNMIEHLQGQVASRDQQLTDTRSQWSTDVARRTEKWSEQASELEMELALHSRTRATVSISSWLCPLLS